MLAGVGRLKVLKIFVAEKFWFDRSDPSQS